MQAIPDPPSLQQVFQVITDAASQNFVVAQAASTTLDSYKGTPGFYQSVQLVALERNLPLDVRKMAIFQFKNGVPGQWRRGQLYPESIKQNIRARMFGFFDEPDDIIAQTNAIAVAKICRIDYPRYWPDLGTQLLEVITTNSQAVYASADPNPNSCLALRRSLTVLNQVMKELSSGKVPTLTAGFQVLIQQLHEPLLALFNKASEVFANGLTLENLACDDKLNHIRISHLSFKCLVKGVTFLWQRSRVKGFEGSEAVRAFFEVAVDRFFNFSNLRIGLFQQNINPNLINSPTQSHLARHVRTYGKYFRKTQVFSVARFVKLPKCQELVFYYWDKVVQVSNLPTAAIQDSDQVIYPIRFITQALSIFKDSVAQWSPSRQSDDSAILNKGFVEEAVQLIITRLLLLDEEDLEKWSEDPEEWINIEESDSDAWEFGVRPCAERVLMTLSNQYGDYVTPLISSYLGQVVANPATDFPSILRKEALYCAVGRCAHRLRDITGFDGWISQSLTAEALDPNPNYRIVKRRIAWLFGRWFAEGNATDSRAKVYEVLVHLIQTEEGSDAVVRLTAATALKDCVNSVSFDGPTFFPYMPIAVPALLNLLGSAESQDAKKRVLRSLNVIIEAAREQIVPLLGDIINAITVLWQQPDADIPLRAEMMTTVSNLVRSSKEHSAPMSPVAAILIRECFSPGLDVQMDEDAIELWLIVLRNSLRNLNPAVPDLFELLPSAIGLLGSNLDLLGPICQIMESYILLDCPRVLQMQALPLHKAFLEVYQRALLTNIKDMLSVANLMVQLAPSSLWAEAMHTSQFFAKLLASLIEDKSKNDNTLVLVEVINLFARMILQDSAVFVQLVVLSSDVLGKPADYLMNGFLDQWWAKFDNIVDAPRRKLVALATAELLATGNSEIIDRISSSEAFNIWLDVLGELKEAMSQRPGDDEQECVVPPVIIRCEV
ncbi:hypothetical protein M408DRAFT_81094 [Serendipita vermifera MAFF 305830]|uniref:Importin N-terminal domain-containing protein n=1 Tax=Serendipita vermifera MAFF 305830 TaxID=933852 RepID=A0A0C3A8Q8_SERVB|nr:hypothetical protein M408DRAFT_81094 [Serendipita vermifera MAFF 305830]